MAFREKHPARAQHRQACGRSYPPATPRDFPSLQKPLAFQSVSERFMSLFKWGIRAKNPHVSTRLSACIASPIRLMRFRAFQSVSQRFIDHGD